MNGTVRILFENENLVAVEKPAMTLSVPARTADDPRPVMGKLLESQLNQKIYPVHRLDFEVSGVMVYALNPIAHKLLNQGFEQKTIKKTYLAMTQNSKEQTLPKGEQTWRRQILRGKKRSYESPHGEWAETTAEVIFEDSKSVNWRLSPITGKPHQLRVELYLQGYPILGDTLYNSQSPWAHPGIALRSVLIDFPEELQTQLEIPFQFEVEPWT